MGQLREKGNNSRVRRASSNKIVMKLEHAKLDLISGVNFTDGSKKDKSNLQTMHQFLRLNAMP